MLPHFVETITKTKQKQLKNYDYDDDDEEEEEKGGSAVFVLSLPAKNLSHACYFICI